MSTYKAIRLLPCPLFGGSASVESKITRGTGKGQWACAAVLRILSAAICLQKTGITHTERHREFGRQRDVLEGQ